MSNSYQEKLAELRALRRGEKTEPQTVQTRMAALREQRQGGGDKAEPAADASVEADHVIVWAGLGGDTEIDGHVAALLKIKPGAKVCKMAKDVERADHVTVIAVLGVTDVRDPKMRAELERLQRAGSSIALEVHVPPQRAPFAAVLDLADSVSWHMPGVE